MVHTAKLTRAWIEVIAFTDVAEPVIGYFELISDSEEAERLAEQFTDNMLHALAEAKQLAQRHAAKTVHDVRVELNIEYSGYRK